MAHIIPELYGRRIKDIAAICHVDLTTARRWKRGALCPPFWARALLSGDLGFFSPYWRGWRIVGEEIIPPAAWPVRRDDALAVPLMHSQIAALRQDIERLKAELEEARSGRSEQPHPDSWVLKIG